MAAVLLVVGGAMITERVQKDKEKKRLKKEHDETRYRELIQETGRRLSLTDSGQAMRRSTGGVEEAMQQEHEAPLQVDDDMPSSESNPETLRLDEVRSQDSSHNKAKKKRGFRGLFRKR